MQKATRNTFTQKGSEVQKIIQSGIWAYVESSYLNPNFDSACNGYEVGEGEGRIISVAKWIYRCKRLLRKSNHIAVSVDNGEVLEPCYLIEPSSDDRLQDKTLVWLEPLPQLNGYVIIPGGTSQCGEGYGSGSGLGPGSSIGSNPSLGDCDSLLNCLCVEKNSEGRVTGLFVKKSNGILEEVGACHLFYTPCFIWGPYVADYQIQVAGEQHSGTMMHRGRYDFNFEDRIVSQLFSRFTTISLVGDFYRNPDRSFGELDVFFIQLLDPYSFNCVLRKNDVDIVISGCPGAPTFYITILPGRCISGWFTVRLAGTRTGGGRGYSPCCPAEHPVHLGTHYIVQYDLTINDIGLHITGYSDSGLWANTGDFYAIARRWDSDVWDACRYVEILFSLLCGNNMLFASVYLRCSFTNRLYTMHLQPGYEEWESSVEGCPDFPIFYFVSKPGRSLSGWFKVMPYRP